MGQPPSTSPRMKRARGTGFTLKSLLGSMVIVVVVLLVHVSINCWDLLAAIGAQADTGSG